MDYLIFLRELCSNWLFDYMISLIIWLYDQGTWHRSIFVVLYLCWVFQITCLLWHIWYSSKFLHESFRINGLDAQIVLDISSPIWYYRVWWEMRRKWLWMITERYMQSIAWKSATVAGWAPGRLRASPSSLRGVRGLKNTLRIAQILLDISPWVWYNRDNERETSGTGTTR